MASIKRYASFALLLAACSQEPQTIVVQYRPSERLGRAGNADQSLAEKASDYAIDSGLARKLWENLPDEKKWAMVKAIIDNELGNFADRKLSRLEDNFHELCNFLMENYVQFGR